MNWRIALAITAGSAALCAGIGLTVAAAWLITRAADHPSIVELTGAIVAVRAFGVSKGVLRYTERLLAHDAAFKALAGLRLRVYKQLTRRSASALQQYRLGDLLARLGDDVTAIQDRVSRVVIPGASIGIAGIVAVIIAALLLPAAGLVLLTGLLVATVASPAFSVRLAAWSDRRLAASRADLSNRIIEQAETAEELIVHGALEENIATTHRGIDDLARAEARLAWTRGLSTGLAMLALAGTLAGIVVAATPAVADGHLSGPGFAILLLLTLATFDVGSAMPGVFVDNERVRASLARVDDILHTPPDLRTTPLASVEPHGHGIVVRNMSARWPGHDSDVLTCVDFRLPPGSRVAIMGPSGAGKSTLLAALLGLCVTTGNIELGGVPLAAVPEDRLRRTIGLASPDTHVFDSTIEANLRLARPEATEVEIRSALHKAGLLEWVVSQPRGLATSVGEHGHSLSGGQRQRLALARALLADLPILLCDEPDASLDPQLANRLVADLLATEGDRTVVVVTHQPALVRGVDQILLVEGGRLRVQGLTDEVLAT